MSFDTMPSPPPEFRDTIIPPAIPTLEMVLFVPYAKIPRLRRSVVITEKIDGTNAQLYVSRSGDVWAGSRNRWLGVASADEHAGRCFGADNFGFFRFVYENREQLAQLGEGRHYGEWYGSGIQRGYGLKEKRLALFLARPEYPAVSEAMGGRVCVVPTIAVGPFSDGLVEHALDQLRTHGSYAASGFADPEGIVIFHSHSRTLTKVTLDNDSSGKGEQ